MKVKGVNLDETKLGTILGEINPESQTNTQNVASHSLNPKICNAKYFKDKIHYDQNEKFWMVEVAHVCARDWFSGKIAGHAINYNASTFQRVRVLQKLIGMIPLKYSWKL